MLSVELSELQGVDFDLSLLGFDDAELNKLLGGIEDVKDDDFDVDEELWEFDKPKKNADHPTMKPVQLVAYPILNSSMTGCIVLDQFGGMGSA